MDPDSILASARGPFGERRFYPPGEHPATYRTRELIRRLVDTGDRYDGTATASLKASIEYHERNLAAFEAGEYRAKAHYLRAVGDLEG